ncbi:hypothetical protein [Allobaculum mucilyticum]|uniref:hypothetical protein n=1 Tax=Allobaculum mucilyticum TaxID=2834459 RepID=UPI001E4D9C19|nr:hypothetical protein [Allobaculum mucilyticum]UNT96881.1 hypothetical protein KWG62_03745 [Allobaculum mucilyticum]
MKNSTLTKWLIGLVCVLIVVAGLSGAAFYSLNRSIQSVAGSFTGLAGDSGKIDLSNDETMAKFYGAIASELEQYGASEKTDKALSRLLTQAYVKTLKDCTVESVEYTPDRFIIHVQGVAVPMDKLNESLVVSAAAQSVKDYVLKNPMSAIGSLFKGEEGIKEAVYGEYASLFLDALREKIMAMDVEPVHYTLTVQIKDGDFSVEMSQANKEEEKSTTDTITP